MSRLLSALADHYLAERAARGARPRTIECWRGTLKHLIAFLAGHGIDRIDQVTPHHLTAYQEHLMGARGPDQRPVSLGRQAQRVCEVRIFFTHWLKRGVLLVSPAAHLELPRLPRRFPRHVPDEASVKRLLDQPDVTTALGLRDRAILELFYSTGLRASELADLDVDDIQTAEGELEVRRGKGAKSRRIPVGAAACVWVDRYLARARSQLVRRAAQTALFLTCRGRRLHRRDLVAIVSGHAARAGLKRRLTPHSLRHAFATHMLRGKAGLRHLQDMLGHAKLATTQIYTRVEISDLKAVHRRCHPRGRG